MTGNAIDRRHENLCQNSRAEKEEEQLEEVDESSKMNVPRLLVNYR